MNKTPKGCSNIGGAAAAKLEYCRNKSLELFARYGYRPFSPAGLQLIEDVWEKISLSRARRLIALTSPFGEPCVLRGDLTLSAVTYLSSHFDDDERPLRISYAERVFSVSPPPRNNLEENQVGVELIGWEGAGADVEIVSLLLRVLDTLSIEDSTVVLGDVSVMSKFFEGLPEETKESLVGALQNGSYTIYADILNGLCVDETELELLRALPSLKGDSSVIGDAMRMLREPRVLMPLKRLCDSLSKLGYAERLRVDLGFVRDLGYYSGPIFNAYSSISGTLLGGGGRYDGLLSKVGIKGEAAGFALNLKELANHCTEGPASPKIMLWCGNCDPAEGLRYADGLSRKGVPFEFSWNSDRLESQRVAKIRKYKWWIDLFAKKALSLQTGEAKELSEAEPEVTSC